MSDILKKNYIKYVNSNTYKLVKKPKNKFRIATYNIHLWTDVFEKSRLKNIMKDIKYIDADVIVLQEVIFGIKYNLNGRTINTEKVIELMRSMNYHTIFCNVLPTWFGGIYGNMMCVKKHYVDKMIDDHHVFTKSKHECIVSGNSIGTKETRCYIILELFDYVIIGIHLDVCSEKERHKQIKYILKILQHDRYKDKKIVILGDFNTTDINQQKDFIYSNYNNILYYVFNNDTKLMSNNIMKILYENKFKSATSKMKITLTTWSGIQSDYIFTKNIKNIFPQILYTPNSDHLPLIIDI
jgi:endonuclease/exonuclease/phosphatase family metal-dependent hydrolase